MTLGQSSATPGISRPHSSETVAARSSADSSNADCLPVAVVVARTAPAQANVCLRQSFLHDQGLDEPRSGIVLQLLALCGQRGFVSGLRDEFVIRFAVGRFLGQTPAPFFEKPEPDTIRRLSVSGLGQLDGCGHAAAKACIREVDGLPGARFTNEETQVIVERSIAALIAAHGARDPHHVETHLGQRPSKQAVVFVAPAAAATLDNLLERVPPRRW